MAELYIIDGFANPVDISTFTEEQKKKFFKDNPNAQYKDENTIEEVKTNDSVEGADALSNEAQELELSSENISTESRLKAESQARILKLMGDYEGTVDNIQKIEGKTEDQIIQELTLTEEASDIDFDTYINAVNINDEDKLELEQEINQISLEPYLVEGKIRGKRASALDKMIQPFEQEIIDAKKTLTNNGQDLTPENIETETKAIVLRNRIRSIENSRAKDFYEDKTKKEQDAIAIRIDNEQDSYKSEEALIKNLEYITSKQASDELGISKKIKELQKSFSDKEYKFEIKEGEETVTLENGKIVPTKVYKEYEGLITANISHANYITNEILRTEAVLGEKNNLYKHADLASRNYSTVNKAMTGAVNSISHMFSNGASMLLDTYRLAEEVKVNLGLGTSQNYATMYSIDEAKKVNNNFYKKSQEKFQKDFYHAPDFSTEINPFGDNFSVERLGEYAAVSLMGQTATMAQLITPGGIYLLGATSYGRTISDQEIADEEAGSETSNLQKRMTAIGYASAEVILGTMPTLRLLGKSTTAFGAAGKRTMYKNMGQFFKAQWDVVPMSFATEYVSEGATQLVQNGIDVINGKKRVSQLLEGVDEAAFTGGLLGPMISGAPFIKGMVLSNFSDWKSFDKFRKNAATIKALNASIAGKNVDNKKSTALRIKRVQELTAENSDILNNLENNVLNNITGTGASLYLSATQQQELIREEAQEYINDKNISNDVKAEKLKDLKSKFDVLAAQRNLYQQDFNIQFNIETAEVQEEYRSKAAKEIGLTQGIDSNKAIEDKAIELYNVDKIEKANNRGFEAMMKLKKSGIGMNYGVEKDNVKLLSKLKIDLDSALENKSISKEQYDELWKDFQEDIKSGKTNGVNFNYIDATTGKRVYNIYVSEANALKNGKTQTAVHEIGHTIFIEGLSTDPEAYAEMADGILAYLKDENSAAYNRVLGNSLGQNVDEVLTNFLEEVSSGRLELEASRKSKDWTSLFGFSLSSALNKQAKVDKAIEFDNVTDTS